jgi:hypothetical protein
MTLRQHVSGNGDARRNMVTSDGSNRITALGANCFKQSKSCAKTISGLIADRPFTNPWQHSCNLNTRYQANVRRLRFHVLPMGRRTGLSGSEFSQLNESEVKMTFELRTNPRSAATP